MNGNDRLYHIGFGRSDRLKKEAAHIFSCHRQVLLEFV